MDTCQLFFLGMSFKYRLAIEKVLQHKPEKEEIGNGRIQKSEQVFCDTELVELKCRLRSKFKSWESLSWESWSYSFEKDGKLEKLKFGLGKFEKLRELEVGYFAEHITLKVKVDKMKFKKVKLV